jgi:predicted acetyltransferase
MNVTVVEASESDRSVIRRLMELYLYDFSEFVSLDVNEHGLFEFPWLDSFWTDDDKHPYLIRAGGKIAGFVLVHDAQEDGRAYHDLSEFFVLKRYRKQGVGRKAAQWVFDQHPGEWHVAEIPENKPAHAFWRRVIGEYTRGDYDETEQTPWQGPLQTFRSRRG